MKISALTGNEFTKLFSKKSTYVIIILALIFCFLVPFMNFKAQNINYGSYYSENLNSELAWTEEALSKYTDAATGTTEQLANIYDYCYQSASYQVVNLKINAGISDYNDWRDMESYNLVNKYVEFYYLGYLIDGNKQYVKAIENSGTMDSVINAQTLQAYYEENSKTKLNERYSKLQSEIQAISQSILNNDAAYFNQFYLDTAKADIAGVNGSIAETQKLMDKTTDNELKAKYAAQIASLQTQLQMQTELLEWKQYRTDFNISRDINDWKNKSISNIESAISFQYQKPYTKEEFDQNSKYDYSIKNMSYEDYLTYFENQKAAQREQITLYKYHLDNNIPPAEYAASTRMQLQNIYVITSLTALVGIILAAPIVSQEYHKGTIRLLLTRPVKRYKILLSKILALFILLVVLFVLFAAVYIASDIALFGAEDFKYPMISISGGEIISKTILETVLPVLSISTLSIFFIVSMSVMLSTVVKSTVLAVALPFVFMAFSNIISLLLIQLQYYSAARYTVFAYMNLDDVINKTGNIGSMMTTVPQLGLDPNIGILQFAVFGVLMLILSFWVFSKRDVKN